MEARIELFKVLGKTADWNLEKVQRLNKLNFSAFQTYT
jgi:hypothetical protein